MYPLFFSDFNKLQFTRGFFKKFSNINFHEYPSSGMPVDPCGQTDMTKLTVGCRNFGKAPKNRFCNSIRSRHQDETGYLVGS